MNTLDALKVAREAMKERRAYCPQWEYKYGHEWDNEDGYIQDAITKMEAERTDIDARIISRDISTGALDYAEYWDNIVPKLIQQYAESYHERRMKEAEEIMSAEPRGMIASGVLGPMSLNAQLKRCEAYHEKKCAECKALPADDGVKCDTCSGLTCGDECDGKSNYTEEANDQAH